MATAFGPSILDAGHALATLQRFIFNDLRCVHEKIAAISEGQKAVPFYLVVEFDSAGDARRLVHLKLTVMSGAAVAVTIVNPFQNATS
jgi:hypothetical protein